MGGNLCILDQQVSNNYQWTNRIKEASFLRTIASKRLGQLWRRLNCDPKLNVLYTHFIEEYVALSHMEESLNIDEITSDVDSFSRIMMYLDLEIMLVL
ncbi:hypothetical protein NPIL_143541 [Nephila pilipes]|uniref:Uncharacterized protein n=1 Tax=Nephila pilipes TaxID=299642 RepID=A0A8X6Q0L3_NEPPI|nr:hypothetical protein NPIL_143541 [Nephila pilipes]